jgi:hypothetical protein
VQSEENGSLVKVQHHRASALPRELACPASHVEPDETLAIPLVDGGEDADLGSAVHEVLALWIANGRMEEKIHEASQHWGVDSEDVAKLSWTGWRLWQSLERFFPSPTAEVGMGPEHACASVVFTGHIDLVSIDAGVRQLRLLDWKTGYLDTDFTSQLKAYGWLALRRWPHLESVYACTVRIRAGEIDGNLWSREELDLWAAESAARLANPGYSPGSHCRYCPRRLGCPAIASYLRQAAWSLLSTEEFGGAWSETGITSPQTMADMLDHIKSLEAVMENVKSAIKDAVAAASGRLETDDGRELVLSRQERRKIAATPASHKILTTIGGMTEDEWYQVLTVGKTKTKEIVKSHAPRGSKGTAAKEVIDALSESGQLSTQFIEKLEIRRKPLAVTGVTK